MISFTFRAGVVCAALLAYTPFATAVSSTTEQNQPTAQVWVTTLDRSEQLNRRADVVFTAGGSDALTITVDPSRSYQEMDGFGASLTDGSAFLLSRLPSAQRAKVMQSLFDPKNGIGLSFLRQPMGASDFVAGQHYTYDDVPAGTTDFQLRNFTVAHDSAQILPLLLQARALNPQLKVFATPWSPPAWMKTNESLVGGRLKDDDRIYETYAQYFVRFIKAYQAAGVPVNYVTVQNEPQNRTPKAYPGMDMPVADQVRMISRLGPALQNAGLTTEILGYDHNWSVHPDDLADTPPGRDPEPNYAADILSSPAAKWVAGTGFHCYFGDPSAQTTLHDAFPEKGIWFTECSGIYNSNDSSEKNFAETIKWHARNIIIGTTRNWAKSVVNWNLALDPQGGPHNGGCDTCTGVITIDSNGTVTLNAEYYTLGHASKFVRPGARRIASSSYGTTGWNGQIMDVAFRNPDGSTVLVVHNQNDAARSFAVSVGDYSFDYTLPGGSLATFVWPAHSALRNSFDSVDLSHAGAVVWPMGDNPAALVDNDALSRWTTGTGQVPGQYLQINLESKTSIKQIVLDSGASMNDYARSWALYASDDCSDWNLVSSGHGTGQLTTIDGGHRMARCLRVVNTGTADNWWSVADVHVYR